MGSGPRQTCHRRSNRRSEGSEGSEGWRFPPHLRPAKALKALLFRLGGIVGDRF